MKVVYLLKNKEELDGIGGVLNVTKILSSYVPSKDDLFYYIDIIKQFTTLREIKCFIDVVNQLLCSDYPHPASEIVDFCRKKSYELENFSSGKLAVDFKEDFFEKTLEELKKGEGSEKDAVPTGLSSLDKLIGGFGKGQLITIAARTGMGKTAFALNLATSMAKSKKPIYFFSIEMTYREIKMRILSQISNIQHDKIKQANLSPKEIEVLINSVNEFDAGTLLVNDSSKKIDDIISKATRAKEIYNISALFVDYLQLVSPRKREDLRYLEVGEITKSLKDLAKYLDIPVICLCQLSRKVEDRNDHKPMLSDLKESGSIRRRLRHRIGS